MQKLFDVNVNIFHEPSTVSKKSALTRRFIKIKFKKKNC